MRRAAPWAATVTGGASRAVFASVPPSPLVPAAIGLVGGLALGGVPHGILLAPLVLLGALGSATRARLARGALLGLLAAQGAPEGTPAVAAGVHPITARVARADPPGRWGTRAELEDVRVRGPGGEVRRPGRLRLRLPRRRRHLHRGDRIRLLARLATDARRPDLPWVARPAGGARITLLARGRGAGAAVDAARHAAARRLEATLSAADAGLIRALVLGDRGALAAVDRHRFRHTGQGHLVAVSGLHVGLLLMGLLALLRRAGVGRRLGAAVGVGVVAAYVPLAGAPPSAVRAGLGAVLALGAVVGGRRPRPDVLLAVVALLLLTASPRGLGDRSLTLSLSAVTSILLLAPRLDRLLVPPRPVVPGVVRGVRAPLRRSLAVALAAWLATLPALAAMTGRVAPAAAPLSIVAVPLTALLVGGGLVLLLLGGLAPVAGGVVVALESVAGLLRGVLDVALRAGLGARETGAPPPWWSLLWALLLLAAIVRPRRDLPRLLLGLALLLGLLPVVGTAPDPPGTQGVGVTAAPYDPRALMPDPLPPTDPIVLGAALAFALFAVVAVRPLGWLTPRASGVGALLGLLGLAAFGVAGAAALVAPFLVATLLGRLPGARREGRRRLRQVLANGLPAIAGALLALLGLAHAGFALFAGSLACLGADTSATEVGLRLGGTPRRILDGRPIPPGESGGVTGAGLLAAWAGAALAPGAVLATGDLGLRAFGLLVLAGLTGSVIDSLLGATLQYRGRDPATGHITEALFVDGRATEPARGIRWLDNDGVNLVSATAAGLLAWALLAAFG